ncbi:HNH endonuclease [Euryarchaeota archaeon]|nr:HNH endonuclease [Euryarchaeota archaeon]MDC3267812.1 HNH endonuclease [bacterium]
MIGSACPICRVKLVAIGDNTPTIEHIIPLSNGGSNRKNNLTVICRACNHARNFVKQFFENKGERVPVEYWQCSLLSSLLPIVEHYYYDYHKIFLNARFG